ncbi:MAG: PKD domain-containing protein [Clostridiaceae bacterium]|nr:PKD domain-containing protein [Clostridiaceae bacterium]
MGRFKSLLACVLAVLMLGSIIMPDVSFADNFSSEQAKYQENSLESQSVSQNVYDSPIQTPVQTVTNEPVVTLLPDVTSIPTPELELPTEIKDEISSITLPLEERREDQDSIVPDGYVTQFAKIVNDSFGYKDTTVTEEKITDETIPEIKENEVVIFNEEGSTEKISSPYMSFTPTSSAVYIVTVSKETLDYVYIYDVNNNNTVAYLRTYPTYANSVAYKLYKGMEYRIYLSIDVSSPTELMIKKYESENPEVIYKFSNNTYTAQDNASIIVDMPSLRADIAAGALEGDLVFSAELIKDGLVIDSISEIPQDCIRGGIGEPDDNYLQFVCNFNKQVDPDKYTVRIKCNDYTSQPVIENCEAEIEIGNRVNIYVAEGTRSIRDISRFYLNDTNATTGKFLVLRDGKAIGMSDSTNIYQTTVYHNFLNSNYGYRNDQYNEKYFNKKLYYMSVPQINFNEILKEEGEYTVKFVSGISEFDVPSKIVVTDELIFSSMYYNWSLYENTDNFIVTGSFYNLTKVDVEKINVELVDLSGRVVGTKIDYSHYTESQIRFRLKITEAINLNSTYSVKISYPGKIYSSDSTVSFRAYTTSTKLYIESVSVTDIEKGEVLVSTEWCDKSVGYEVALYRMHGESLYIPISNITDVKADNNGVFSLKFPNKGNLQILNPGGNYHIKFLYDGREIDSKSFTIPSHNDFSEIDKKISFYPSILPDDGTVDFTIAGYEIDNGIMGADNKNINIELVSEDEVYGSLDKNTIEKSVSSYKMNGNYNVGYVVIKGKLNITKTLKDETKYFIRINGMDYEYYFNSKEQKFSSDSLKIENYSNSSYSSFVDSEGNTQMYYILNNEDALNLSCSWVKDISENPRLVFVNVDTKAEIDAGVWDTVAQSYKGSIKEISINADLSKIVQNDIYEICLKDDGQNYSFKKYVKFSPKSKASSFTVSEAVYGSDIITLIIDNSYSIDGYSFNILDSLDNIIDCAKVSERVDNQKKYIDLKLDTPLKYGFCKIQMFDDTNMIKYYTTNYITDKKVVPPLVQYVKEGYPYLVYCENLEAGLSYTADIYSYDTAVRMKHNIKLVKRTDEDVLEIDQNELGSLPIGSYTISVKADGVVIGVRYFNYNGTYELKPVITPSEWEEGTSRKPFILSNNVKFDIRTLNYTKVRYSQNVEELKTLEYQTVSNDVYYTFDNDDMAKTLYFQFSDDYGNESDLSVFKAYINDNKNDITVISPKEGVDSNSVTNALAEVTNDPYFVGVIFYRKDNYTISNELKRTDGTDKYSASLSSIATLLSVVPLYEDTKAAQDCVEVFTTDEVGNITSSKIVKLRQNEVVTSPSISLDTSIGEKKSELIIKGNTSNGAGNVTISLYAGQNNRYNSWASYSIKLLADAKGDFEGVLDVPVDGSYKIVARDFKGTESYLHYRTIDTIAPILSDYSTVAQGNDSVRISWTSSEHNNCSYTLWKNGKLITSNYRLTEYITAGLNKGQTYVFKIVATDNAGNKSEPVEISVKIGDEEKPSIPQNLVVSDHASKSITISWDASSDNSYTSGYEIYRDGEKVGVSYTTKYLDSNLETGTQYSYKVRAFDPSMNFSDFSETISHTPTLVSISDAYDGKSSVVGFSAKKLELKVLTDDILNKNEISVRFEYKNSEETNWRYITETNTHTVTPNGLLFTVNWNVEYMAPGDYTVRYRLTDRDGYNIEVLSETITILSAEDIQSPRIISINPAPSCFANTIPLTITAEDNISLKKITIQTSLDGVTWNDYTQRTLSYGSKKITNYTYYIDVSEVREGNYYVRAIAEDFGGNVSNSTNTYNQYIIDRTAPDKVDGISAFSYVDCIEIKWNNNIEPYIKGFRVLRSLAPTGSYISIASNLKSLNYFDFDTVPGETYYYKVVCEDIAGNLSPDSDFVEITMLDAGTIVDNVKPEITSVYPPSNAVVGRILTYALTAKDDTRLSKLAAEYSLDGLVWKEFHSVSSVYEVDGFTAELDTSLFPTGTVLKTRGYAVDIKGNTSEYVYCDYIINNVAPIAPVINVTPIARGLTITWSCDATDIVTYRLYRRTTETEFYTVVGEYATTLSVVDNNLDPSKKYIYKITAVDKLGNSSETLSDAVSPLDIDNVKPIPYINCVSSTEVDTEVDFDASASKDNVGIAKYLWDFGDGTKGEGIRVQHSYTTPGEYKVILKVVDESNNEESTEKLITVLEKDYSGVLNITVKDNLGNHIPGTTIYVNVGTAEEFKMLTDSSGKISLKLQPGSYDIGAYQAGYAPKQQDVLIVKNEENNLSFVLEESKIIVGNITATKMTLEEIKAAGIDVNAPGNQNVFRYEINLNYNNKPYRISHIPSSSNSSGGTYSVGGREVGVKTYTNPKTKEVFVLLIDIPGRVTWLKEFFDVKLHLLNTEGTYALKDCVATLKTPNGISIAGGNDQTVSIGTIAAKDSKTIEWIVRGDAPGSYHLSADFSGTIETFNEQISASFKTENPIVVDNSSGLRLIIEVEKAKYSGDDLLYRVGFVNEKSSEIYMPNINMGNSTFIRSYKTKEDMSLVKTSSSVLWPGEILWEEYSADNELFEGHEHRTMALKELASKALGGLEMPIETRMVEYGTFGRVKAQFYIMPGEINVDLLTLTKFRSKENDTMPSLKIVTGRGISQDVIVHEKCEITIEDNVKKTVTTIVTDNNGEHIYEGYSLDDVKVGSSGIEYFTIVVSSDKTRMIPSSQRVRIIDQNLLPAEDFGSISGYVFDEDLNRPISNATIKVDIYETHTGTNGRFYFEDILLTDDHITVNADGFPQKTVNTDLRDGSYVRIPMTRLPEVTKVISAVSNSTKPTSSILPLNLIRTGGAIRFNVYTDLKGAGEVRKYLYKIVNRYGVIKFTGESTSSTIKVENIRSKMSMGDRILFAVEAEGTYGIATSEYVDAKLVMAKEFPFLNAVSWQNNLESAFEENFNFDLEEGLDGFLKFVTGEGTPDIDMPSDSGPIKSLGIESAGLDFDLDVKYDFYNAKATFTSKAGAKLGVNGEFANFDVPDQVESFLGTGITTESEVTVSLICVYNDSTMKWEIESYKFIIANETEIRVLTFEFKFRVPLDATFGGVLLSGYVSLEVNGTLTFKTNVSIGGPLSFESVKNLMIELEVVIGLTLRAAIGVEVGYGLIGGEFWAQGGLEFTIPTGKTVLSLSMGFKETFVWFISTEQVIDEREWTVYDPSARQAQSNNNSYNRTNESITPEKKSVKREVYAAPITNSVTSKESSFETSPRDYLEKQKWIGEKDIIQYAYPQSEAKISELDGTDGDMIMVFIGDDRERTDNNRTALFYSIYDNKKWSEPKQVENDGTADAFPNLSTDGRNSYAIWLDMPEKIGNLPKVSADYITENIISKMKLEIAKYDSSKDAWVKVLSPETEGLNKLPQIAADGGKTIAAWVSNSGKKAVGTKANPDSIYYVYNNGTSWTAPKAFITNSENVNESDLLLYDGKAYFVYTTNAYSENGIHKLYATVFDGKTWSKPRGLLDNMYNDSHPSIAVENGKPVVFWNNSGLIYKAEIESGKKDIVVNSSKAFGVQELQATNTDEGIALAWTTATGGEQRLFISTYEDTSSTWTQGVELAHNSMEIPRDITIAGNGNEIMAVYNKSVYKKDDENSKYYYDGTLLTSTSYVRKVDLAIPADGMYFGDNAVLPGEQSKVYVEVENVGDLTAKNFSVSLYDGGNLVDKKEINRSISHGDSLITEFDYSIPKNSSAVALKGAVDVLNDANTSNNTSQLVLSYVDVEVTRVYNALYEKNRGYLYVDITNNGSAVVNSAKVEVYADKEFKNLIASKELTNIYPALIKKSVIEFEVSDQQISDRARLYTKVVIDQPEYDYTNNSSFTIIRPYEFNLIPGTVTPEPTPVTPKPTPVTPEPTPVTPEPTSATPRPTPSSGNTGSSGSGSSGSGSSGTGGTTGSTTTPTTTPIPTTTPTPSAEVTEKPKPSIPGSDGKHKGYMQGYEGNMFKPENNITRAEMAAILANLDGIAKVDKEYTTFKDVSMEHWTAWAIAYVTDKGYFIGYEDDTFRPSDYITRAELSVVLCKYLKLNEFESVSNDLTDINGHWAEGYIKLLSSKGYIKGYLDKTFKPNNNIKRSECTALINRVLGLEALEGSKNRFIDVDDNHWAYKDILIATQN